MLTFDIHRPPPTRQEIQTEKERLAALKKRLLTQSVISDIFHGLSLLLLYFYDLLSGYGLLAVMALGTVITVVLATSLKDQLRKADLLTVIVVALATGTATSGTIYGLPNQSLAGCIVTGILTTSIIIFSTLIGRRLFQVFNGLESLKNLLEFEGAEEELNELCRNHPACEEYRQQALQILRPNLTLAELEAMRRGRATASGQHLY